MKPKLIEDNKLPEGVTKQDLVKADPPVYVSAEQQAAINRSFEIIELHQTRKAMAEALIENAVNQQQVLLRDILEDMGASRKTHQLARDSNGAYFLDKIAK